MLERYDGDSDLFGLQMVGQYLLPLQPVLLYHVNHYLLSRRVLGLLHGLQLREHLQQLLRVLLLRVRLLDHLPALRQVFANQLNS